MKGLKSTDNFIDMEASSIVWGKYEDEDKWALYDADGKLMYYALDHDYTVVEFDATSRPEDYVPFKYRYIDGEWVLNPDWVAPAPTIEERVDTLEDDAETLSDYTTDLLYQVCLLQLGMSEEDVEEEE